MIYGDYLRIKQVVLNLLSNAAKYNTKGGAIQVNCSTESEGMLKITIADNGNGISEKDQRELFQPFSRLNTDNSSSIGGTGIGLAVCKILVEQMHGRIGVESKLGKGSSFWFELPIAPDLEKKQFT